MIVLLNAPAVLAEPATESSIRKLLQVTDTRKMLESMQAQTDAWMKNAVSQALGGASPTAAQEECISRMREKMKSLVQEQMAWEKMEPMYLRLYQETFTQEEIAGMLDFYQTPAGKALIVKMPVLMQKSMQEMQKTMSTLIPQIQGILEDFANDMVALEK